MFLGKFGEVAIPFHRIEPKAVSDLDLLIGTEPDRMPVCLIQVVHAVHTAVEVGAVPDVGQGALYPEGGRTVCDHNLWVDSSPRLAHSRCLGEDVTRAATTLPLHRVSEWNTLTCIRVGDCIAILRNGNPNSIASKRALTHGRFLIEAQFSEIIIRRFDVRPHKASRSTELADHSNVNAGNIFAIST
jgi:hypothetical protein